MALAFDITPEKQAGPLHFFKSQLFETKCPLLTQKDANLTGKTAIITGGNVGVGLETARQLLRLGVTKLILAVRNEESGAAAAKALESDHYLDSNKQTIEVWKLDLSSYDSITNFTERVRTLKARPDIVVLNAGVLKVQQSWIDSTGHDEDVQINYLSTVLLLVLLLGVVKQKASASAASSPVHFALLSTVNAHWAKFPERNAEPLFPAFDAKDNKYDFMERYGTSKLLVLLFLSELVKIVPAELAIINAPTPGMCYGSRLSRDGDGTLLGVVFGVYMRLVGLSTSVGARNIVDAVVKKGPESHGQYLENGKLRPLPQLMYTSEGEQVAKKLWKSTIDELSFAGVGKILEDLTGVVNGNRLKVESKAL